MFAAALATGAMLALAPVIATASCVASPLGSTGCSSTRLSLLQHEGAGVLGVLALPALVAVVPVIIPSRRSRMATAIALTAATLLGIASVGVFLLPTVLLAWFPTSRHDVAL